MALNEVCTQLYVFSTNWSYVYFMSGCTCGLCGCNGFCVIKLFMRHYVCGGVVYNCIPIEDAQTPMQLYVFSTNWSYVYFMSGCTCAFGDIS